LKLVILNIYIYIYTNLAHSKYHIIQGLK